MDVAKTLMYNEYYVATADEDFLSRHFPGYDELTRIQRVIFHEFVNIKKIIGSWSTARELIRAHFKAGVDVTDDDIIWAYAVGAGGGCEFEFPYE